MWGRNSKATEDSWSKINKYNKNFDKPLAWGPHFRTARFNTEYEHFQLWQDIEDLWALGNKEIYEKNVAEGKEIPTRNHKNFIKNIKNTLGQCFLNSEEVSIKFLEDYIYNRMSEWFKNPELVKNLNYLGEPK